MFFDLDSQPEEKKRCNLHTIPLKEFLNMPPVPQEVVDKHFGKQREWLIDKMRFYRHYADPAQPIGDTGYAIQCTPGPDNLKEARYSCVIITHLASGDVVGGCTNMDFFIDPQHRGKGLGAVALLRALDEGVKSPLNSGHALSPNGKRARTSAHRLAVTRALEEGIEVPENVLKDYPEFFRTPAPSAPATDYMDDPSP